MSTALEEMGFYLVKSMLGAKRKISHAELTKEGAKISFVDGSVEQVIINHKLSPTLFCEGTLVVSNTKENVQVLIDNWVEALTFEKMTILFLDEATGNKWLLRPRIHAKIAEPKTLSQGLFSLFEQSLIK